MLNLNFRELNGPLVLCSRGKIEKPSHRDVSLIAFEPLGERRNVQVNYHGPLAVFSYSVMGKPGFEALGETVQKLGENPELATEEFSVNLIEGGFPAAVYSVNRNGDPIDHLNEMSIISLGKEPGKYGHAFNLHGAGSLVGFGYPDLLVNRPKLIRNVRVATNDMLRNLRSRESKNNEQRRLRRAA